MIKECRCGKLHTTDDKRHYCDDCQTYAHPAYVQKRDNDNVQQKDKKAVDI